MTMAAPAREEEYELLAKATEEICDEIGFPYARTHLTLVTKNGTPDLVIFSPAGALSVHVKPSPYAELSEPKREWKRRALASGLAYDVFTSADVGTGRIRAVLESLATPKTAGPGELEAAQHKFHQAMAEAAFAELPPETPVSAGPPVYFQDEKDFQSYVTEIARALGIFAYSVPDSRRVSERGMSDLLLVGNGFAFAELKMPHGKIRPDQAKFRSRVLAAGGSAYVWRPGDLSSGEVYRVLHALSPIHWGQYSEHREMFPLPSGQVKAVA